MTLSRILAAAGVAALLGGAASAQTMSDERPKDTVGNTPADATVTDDMNVTATVVAPSATESAMPASTLAPDNAPGTITTRIVTNGPVADTPENRALYGQPMSRAGKMTSARGN